MKTRILLAALWSLALCARTTVAAEPGAADQDEARGVGDPPSAAREENKGIDFLRTEHTEKDVS